MTTTTATPESDRTFSDSQRTAPNRRVQRAIWQAMQAPDDLVVEMIYQDASGKKSRRVVSPIRFLEDGRFLGLCLCRCAPRQFHIERCLAVRLRRASDYVMPVPMQTAS